MPFRRLAVTVLSAASAAAALALAPTALARPVPPGVPPAHQDQITVTVTGTEDATLDGAYTLDCHPSGGTHRAAAAACTRLDEVTRWGTDPFAPVSPEANCTTVYGGPATARLTGTWAGRPVDAAFTRVNGCEMSRWSRLEPVLPAMGS